MGINSEPGQGNVATVENRSQKLDARIAKIARTLNNLNEGKLYNDPDVRAAIELLADTNILLKDMRDGTKDSYLSK